MFIAKVNSIQIEITLPNNWFRKMFVFGEKKKNYIFPVKLSSVKRI